MDIPQLYVKVLEVCNLPKDIVKGAFQCVLHLDNYELRGTFNPSWVWKDEEFLFYVKNHDAELHFSLFHFPHYPNPNSPSLFVGKLTIPLSSLWNEEPTTLWFNFSSGIAANENKMMKQIKLQLDYTYSRGTHMGASMLLEKNKVFLELLLEPKFDVVSGLSRLVDVAEAQKVASELVNVFYYYNKVKELCLKMVTFEVENTNTTGVLFRGNSMAMKLVSQYAKLVGHQYLVDTLGPIILEIVHDNKGVEVDPAKAKPGEDLKSNVQHLYYLSEHLLLRILNSIEECPMEIRELCAMFKSVVSKKFPNQWHSAVGGFLFLRYFCPACVAPEGFRILSELPSEQGRRALVLVTKSLQNLANGVVFGDKEEYMKAMNPFITQNLGTFQNFIEKISQVPSDQVPTERFTPKMVTPIEVMRDLKNLSSNLNTFFDKILKENISISRTEFRRKLDSFIPMEMNPVHKLHNVSAEQLVRRGAMRILKQTEIDEKNKGKKTREVLGMIGVGYIPEHRGFEKQIILNEFNENSIFFQKKEIQRTSNPCELSEVLLAALLELYIKHSYTRDNDVITNWAEIQESDEYKKFSFDAASLHYLDPSQMSVHERSVFFINIVNALIIHIHVVAGPPITLFKQRSTAFFNVYKYNIGGSEYSVNDIQHGILRGNPKLGFGRVFEAADKRLKCVIPEVDGRVHFAISFLTKSSPILRIFSANFLEEDLQDATIEYFNEFIEINVAKKELSLPECFSKYASDFPKTKEELMNWLFQFVEDKKKYEMLKLMELKNVTITYKPFNWSPQVKERKQTGQANKHLTRLATLKVSSEQATQIKNQVNASFIAGNDAKQASLPTNEEKPANASIYDIFYGGGTSSGNNSETTVKKGHRRSASVGGIETKKTNAVIEGIFQHLETPETTTSAPASAEVKKELTSETLLAVIMRTSKKVIKSITTIEEICNNDKNPPKFEQLLMFGSIVAYCVKQSESARPLEPYEPDLKLLKTTFTKEYFDAVFTSLLKSLSRLNNNIKEQQNAWNNLTMKELVTRGKSLRNIKNAMKYISTDFSSLKTLLDK